MVSLKLSIDFWILTFLGFRQLKTAQEASRIAPRGPKMPSRWSKMAPRRHALGWPSTKRHRLPRPSSPPPSPSPTSSCSYLSSSSSRPTLAYINECIASLGKERASRIACTVPRVNTPDNIYNAHERY